MPLARPRLLSSLALAATAATACSGDSGPPPDAAIAFDRRAMLANLATAVYVPAYAEAAARTRALTTAVDALCTALTAGPAATEDAAAGAAWRAAAEAWQTVDAVLVGPAAADDAAARNRIYAWPLVAPCAIDQDVVARWTNPGGFDVATRLDNARSLAAIEYLLFYRDAATSCPLPPAGWDALGADLARARCGLAGAIAADVATQAATLATAWAPGGGDYGGALARAGTAGSTIASERDAVNMVSDGLFYLDDMVKDMKLGEAAGIVVNACGTIEEPCLREVEHRFADHATAALRANLRATRAVFAGADGLGFDDYLTAAGAPELATRLITNLDRAIALADALPPSFLTALASERDAVVELHGATRAVTDDLKSQFLTVLGLDIPDDVAGDND